MEGPSRDFRMVFSHELPILALDLLIETHPHPYNLIHATHN